MQSEPDSTIVPEEASSLLDSLRASLEERVLGQSDLVEGVIDHEQDARRRSSPVHRVVGRMSRVDRVAASGSRSRHDPGAGLLPGVSVDRGAIVRRGWDRAARLMGAQAVCNSAIGVPPMFSGWKAAKAVMQPVCAAARMPRLRVAIARWCMVPRV